MELIDKSALVAEIKRIKEIDEIGTYLSPKGVLTNLLCHLNTLEVKEVDNTEYWLVSVRYALNGCDTESNCFFAYFPAKQDIQNAIGAERYTILHIQNLTEEQFNKLTGRAHGI